MDDHHHSTSKQQSPQQQQIIAPCPYELTPLLKLPLTHIETQLKFNNNHDDDDDNSHTFELSSNWLTNDPTHIAISHSCQRISILKNHSLFIANQSPSSLPSLPSSSSLPSNRVMHSPILVPITDRLLTGETLTNSMFWLSFPRHKSSSLSPSPSPSSPQSNNNNNSNSNSSDKDSFCHLLCIGSSEGYLHVFNDNGVLVMRQWLHSAPIKRIKHQSIAHFSGLPEQQMESLLIMFANIVVRLELRSFCSFLRSVLDRMTLNNNNYSHCRANNNDDGHDHDDNDFSDGDEDENQVYMNYQKCEIKNQSLVNDVVCCHTMEQSGFDMFKSKATFHLLVCGTNPMLASYSQDVGVEGSVSVSKMATKYASKASSAIFSFTKSLLWGSEVSEKQEQKTPKKTQPLLQTVRDHTIDDSRREISSLQLDVSGRLIVTSDKLGRIMIIDARSFIILKVLKGYRNAQYCFMNYTFHKTKKNSTLEQKQGLALVIYSPLRGLLEYWNMATWKREYIENVGYDKLLLCAPPAMCLHSKKGDDLSNNFIFHGIQGIFVLDKSGTIERLTYNSTKSSKVSISRENNYGIYKQSATAFARVNSPDDTSVHQFVLAAEKGSTEEHLKLLLDQFSSYSQLIKGLTEILTTALPVATHRELTNEALSILQNNYTTHNDATWSAFQTWTKNRIQLLSVLELIQSESKVKKTFGDTEFEIIEQYNSGGQEWIMETESMYHNYILESDSNPLQPIKLQPSDVALFIDSFKLDDRTIRKGKEETYYIPLRTLNNLEKERLSDILFSYISKSNHLTTKILTRIHMSAADMQGLFVFWIMEHLDTGVLLSISPDSIQKIIRMIFPTSKSIILPKNTTKLHLSSTMRDLEHILAQARKTTKILNAILFLSIYKKEMTLKLETSDSELHRKVDRIMGQLSQILYIKSTLISPRVQSLDMSLEAFEDRQLSLPQLLAKEQVYRGLIDNTTSDIYCGPVNQLLAEFPSLHQIEAEEGVLIGTQPTDKIDTIIKLHCVNEAIHLEHFDLATLYLQQLSSAESDRGKQDYYFFLVSIWDSFAQHHLAELVKWCVENTSYPTKENLYNVTKVRSMKSLDNLYKFYESILAQLITLSQHNEGKQVMESLSTLDNTDESLTDFSSSDSILDHQWPPNDTILYDIRLLAPRKEQSSQTYSQFLSVLRFVHIMVWEQIGRAVTVNLSQLFSKKKVLLPLLRKIGNLVQMKLLIDDSIKELTAKVKLSQKGRKSKNAQLKKQRVKVIRQLLSQNFVESAVRLAESDCLSGIDIHLVNLEHMRILLSTGRDSEAYELLSTIQDAQTRTSVGQMMLEISTVRIANLLHRISNTDNNESIGKNYSRIIAHALTEMPPKLFSYITPFMHREDPTSDAEPSTPTTVMISAKSEAQTLIEWTGQQIKQTKQLLRSSVSLLTQTGAQQTAEYHLAKMLLDFCEQKLSPIVDRMTDIEQQQAS